MKKIIFILALLLPTSCSTLSSEKYEEEWYICIDNDTIEYDAWLSSDRVKSKIDVDYEWRDCKIWRNWRTDIVSCLWDAFYSIECKNP